MDNTNQPIVEALDAVAKELGYDYTAAEVQAAAERLEADLRAQLPERWDGMD